MSSITLGAIVFVCLFGASLIGIVVRNRLPDHHLDSESKDVIRLSTAVVGTLSALALGLLIASANNVYNNAEAELRTSAARLLLLDRVMAQYGPETAHARSLLHRLVENRLVQGWGTATEQAGIDPYHENQGIEPVQGELRNLTPATEPQRLLQARALEVSGLLAEAHWMLVESSSEGLPTAFLVILVFWLAWLFLTFGLQAPANPTVIGVMMVCSLSVAGAIFLVIDMAHPYLGVIHVSEDPLRATLEHIASR
ncbi:bestrophin-like domain [Rhizobium herbae]